MLRTFKFEAWQKKSAEEKAWSFANNGDYNSVVDMIIDGSLNKIPRKKRDALQKQILAHAYRAAANNWDQLVANGLCPQVSEFYFKDEEKKEAHPQIVSAYYRRLADLFLRETNFTVVALIKIFSLSNIS
jgi:hypothetical protein